MIDYQKIAAAVKYYDRLGYDQLEVPWAVCEEANLVTLPKGTPRIITPWGDLIGSAEQGFIDMMFDSLLLDTKYLAVSPCFRIEKNYSEYTRPWFMKVELIDFDPKDPEESLSTMLSEAKGFFQRYLDVNLKVVGEHLWDIESMDGVELGSYGIRRYKNYEWVYGTGLAEPRLTLCSTRSNK